MCVFFASCRDTESSWCQHKGPVLFSPRKQLEVLLKKAGANTLSCHSSLFYYYFSLEMGTFTECFYENKSLVLGRAVKRKEVAVKLFRYFSSEKLGIFPTNVKHTMLTVSSLFQHVKVH
jgi:hypothetical protein